MVATSRLTDQQTTQNDRDMKSIDSPKYRGQTLVASWKQHPPVLGLPIGDWTHCDVRWQELPLFRAVYRDLQYFFAPDCDLTQSVFAHCNLSHADFQRSSLHYANFVSAHLEQARLNSIQCQHGNFAHAHLRSASLQRAQLQRSDFRWSNLQYANFQHADLRFVDLRGSNLAGAKIEGASILNALINQQTVEQSQWKKETVSQWLTKGASWSEDAIESTRWSSGFDLQSKRTTSFNALDALPILCQDIGSILVAGLPPNLFVATPEQNPAIITNRITEIATHSTAPTNQPSSKWEPIHQWLRTGGTITQWDVIDQQIVCTAQLQF